MRNQYTNTVSTVILLLLVFISSGSSRSFIRQYTDDFNTNFQQENGAGPDPIQGEGPYLRKHDQEITSRDYKLSASNTVKGLRDRPPSSYSLKMESFNTLLKSTNTDRYVSRPFSAVGYNWTLVVYPNGNKNDNGAGFISLYAAIDNSTLSPHQELYVDLRFYVFNRIEKKYFTIQDTDGWRFSYFKTMWGFSQVLPVNTLKDSNNGYLYDGDNCEFGVDVTTPTVFKESELFTVADNFHNAKYTWTIQKFSTLLKDTYFSDVFSVGGRSWKIQVNPSGRATGAGKFLSMYLVLSENNKFRPYERIYVRGKLRVLNQRNFNNVEMQYTNVWRFNVFKTFLGFSQVLPVATFKDPRNGYLYDGDHCEFGVDVTIPRTYQTLELFSIADNFYNPKFTWTLRGFSTLLKDTYYSDVFTIGGRSWGTAYGEEYSWGYHEFIPFSELRDSAKGFVVNDMLMVQAELEYISSTKYFPN